MKTLFAMRYEIGPKADEPDLFHAVEVVCRNWIHHVAGRYAPPVPISEERDYLVDRDGIRLESWYFENGQTEAMLRLALEHPDSDRSYLQWKVDVAVVHQEKHVSIRIRIDIASTDDTITVPQFSFSPPKLVSLLLEKFTLSYSGYTVTDKAIRIKAAEIDKLDEFIFLESRDFPIVLLSPQYSGELTIDPAPLVKKLTGVAYVCVLDSPATAKDFRDKVGYEWSCYNGAIRMYWPKARKDGNSRRHRFWTSYELRATDTDALANKLLLDITEAAAFGSSSERDIARIEASRRRMAESRSNERVAQLRAMLEDARKNGSQILSEKERIEEQTRRMAEWTKLLEAELEDKDATKKENQDLHQQLREKDAQIEHLRYALDQSPDSCDEADTAPPKTIEEIVLAVKRFSHDSYFVVLPSAIDSAHDSSFRNPERVYKALLGLSHAAKLYHAGVEGKLPMDLLRALCQVEVSSDISPTARGKYAKSYEFLYGTTKVVAGPHLGTGRGGANDCFRAYWYVDEAKRRYVLCHVGEHLPDDTKN